MKALLICVVLGPLMFLLVMGCAAAALVLGVAFVGWDVGIVTAAWHSFSGDLNWTKIRFGWVIGLIITFFFYVLTSLD